MRDSKRPMNLTINCTIVASMIEQLAYPATKLPAAAMKKHVPSMVKKWIAVKMENAAKKVMMEKIAARAVMPERIAARMVNAVWKDIVEKIVAKNPDNFQNSEYEKDHDFPCDGPGWSAVTGSVLKRSTPGDRFDLRHV